MRTIRKKEGTNYLINGNMGMIGIKVANQTFNASIAKIMRKYISDSISDIKLKVINGEYICM